MTYRRLKGQRGRAGGYASIVIYLAHMTMPFFLNKVLSGKEEGDSEFFTTRNDADQVAGSKFHLRLRVS